MPPRAAAVKHLTETELAERWGVSSQVVAAKRKAGDVPPYLELSTSATKVTRRYPLAGVEAWEQERLVVHASA